MARVPTLLGGVMAPQEKSAYAVSSGEVMHRTSERSRLLKIAAGLLATADHIDPGMSASPFPSSNPKTRAKQDAMKQHYAAYGLRWAVFELFPDLEPGAPRPHPHSCRCDNCWSDAMTEQESQR